MRLLQGNAMKFSFFGKIVLLLQIPGLLLIQTYCPAPLSAKALHNSCSCSAEDAASGACGCAERNCRCKCCAPSKHKSAAVNHPNRRLASVCISAPLCGWPAERVYSSGKIICIFTYPAVAAEVYSAQYAPKIQTEPETLFSKPQVPPPEPVPSFAAALV